MNKLTRINSTRQEEPANTVPARRKKARKSLPKKQETRAVNPRRKTRQDSSPSKPSDRKSRSTPPKRRQQSKRDNRNSETTRSYGNGGRESPAMLTKIAGKQKEAVNETMSKGVAVTTVNKQINQAAENSSSVKRFETIQEVSETKSKALLAVKPEPNKSKETKISMSNEDMALLKMATEVKTAGRIEVHRASETKPQGLAIKSELKKSKETLTYLCTYMCDEDKESPEVTTQGKTASKAGVHRENELKPQGMAAKTNFENGKETAEPNCCEECIEVVDIVTDTGKRVACILSPKILKAAPANKAQQQKVRFVKMIRADGAGTLTLTPTTQSRTIK